MSQRKPIHKILFVLCIALLLLPCFALSVSAANVNCDYMAMTNVRPLHEMGVTGKYEDGTPVRIVVIDTGVDYKGEAFTDEDGNTLISPLSYNASTRQTVAEYGYEVIDDQELSSYHGTAVCGTIVSRLASAPGVAPDVELIVVRMNYKDPGIIGKAFVSEEMVHAVEYAVSLNPEIISISWSMSWRDPCDTQLQELMQTALEKNIFVCVAAGNESSATLDSPAYIDSVLTVGALDGYGKRASYSNYGSHLDLIAPGNIVAVQYGGGVRNIEGTSFACPITSGIAALYISMHPGATVEEVTNALCSTARDIGEFGRDNDYGWGIPDAYAACLANKASLTLICEDYRTELSYFAGTYEALTAIDPPETGGIFTGWYYDEAFTQPVGEDDVFWHDTTLYGGIKYNWTLYENYVTVLASITDYPGVALSYPEREGFIRWTEDAMPAVLGRQNVTVNLFWMLADLKVKSVPTDLSAKANKKETDVFTFDLTHPLADQITYVWLKDDAVLPDQTSDTLTLTRRKDNSGTYYCIASLRAGGQTRTESCAFTVTYETPSRLPIILIVVIALCVVSGAAVYYSRKKVSSQSSNRKVK